MHLGGQIKSALNTREKSPVFRLEFVIGDFSRSSPNHDKLHTLVWSTNSRVW